LSGEWACHVTSSSGLEHHDLRAPKNWPAHQLLELVLRSPPPLTPRRSPRSRRRVALLGARITFATSRESRHYGRQLLLRQRSRRPNATSTAITGPAAGAGSQSAAASGGTPRETAGAQRTGWPRRSDPDHDSSTSSSASRNLHGPHRLADHLEAAIGQPLEVLADLRVLLDQRLEGGRPGWRRPSSGWPARSRSPAGP